MSKHGYTVKFVALLWVFIVAGEAQADSSLYELSLEQLLNMEINSASKSTDVVKNVPASVTILTRDDIALMGYVNLEELLMNVPGFYHVDTYEEFQIGVRGTIGGSIAFLINGVPQHPTRVKPLSIPDRSRTNIPIDSIDRIEIIRGPASVIYGNNAFFGSINVITNDISSQQDSLVAGAGDNGNRQFFVRFTQEADDGQMVLNIGASQTDGITGDLKDMLSARQYMMFADMIANEGMSSSLDGALTQERVNVQLSGKKNAFTYGARYSNMRYGFFAFSPGYDDGSMIDMSSWVVDVGREEVISNGYMTDFNIIYSNEKYFIDPDFVTPNTRGFQHQGSDRLEVEFILKDENMERLKWLTGVNYRKLRHVHNNVDFPDLPYYLYRSTDAINSVSMFANIEYKLLDSMRLIGGYRFSKIFSNDAEMGYVNSDREIATTTFEVDGRDDNAGKFGLIWEPVEQNVFKFLMGSATQDNSSLELSEPETIQTYELNYMHFSRVGSASVSIYKNDINNIRRRSVRSTGGVAQVITDNDSHWKTHGIEFVYSYRPIDNLMVEISGVHQSSEDGSVENSLLPEFPVVDVVSENHYETGEGDTPVGFSPENLLKLKFAYGWDRWRFSASAMHVDTMYSNYNVTLDTDTQEKTVRYYGRPVDSYTTLSLNVHYQQHDSPWFARFHVFNVTDEDIRYPANELVGFHYGSQGLGRQLMVSVGYNWGAESSN